MKKIIYVALITGSMQSTLAMDQEDGLGLSCLPRYGQQTDDQQDQPAQLNLGIVDLFSRATNWIQTSMDELDHAVGAGAAERQAAQNALAPHIQVLRAALAQTDLEQVVYEAVKEKNQERFVSILIGMQALKMRPNADTQSLIQQRLKALKMENLKEAKEVLERQRLKAQQLHELSKQFIAKAELSDDESYGNQHKFVDKLVNDDE